MYNKINFITNYEISENIYIQFLKIKILLIIFFNRFVRILIYIYIYI